MALDTGEVDPAAGRVLEGAVVGRAVDAPPPSSTAARDLLALVHATELEPTAHDPAGATPVSRASLQAGLANTQARNTRLVARIQQLEKRLSEALGEQVWHESGLGAPADVPWVTACWSSRRAVAMLARGASPLEASWSSQSGSGAALRASSMSANWRTRSWV
ncbi:hypothetical protein ACFVZA_32570 [Streptomyces bottropensis]|uniref:hypothetical protein n=1 Tax=Streptomyces bottropensis TaxID=42235 RepID=UPI0036A40D40